jgi:rhodanese-related sulfurtransferase
VVDVRDPADFAEAHLAGSVNVPLASEFKAWAGALLEPEAPLVIVADPGREDEATRRFGRIGLNQVSGYLMDGMQACEERPDLVRKAPRLTRPALEALRASGNRPVVVDVETSGRKRADADLHIPLEELWGRTDEIPEGPMIVLQDEDAFRSSAGASLIRGRGRERVTDLVGGLAAWAGKGWR